jgi:F0F1-type ATP synthase membrane subunit a
MVHQAANIFSAVLVAAGDPKSHVLPHGLFPILHDNIPVPIGSPATEFWFTNHLLMTLVAAVLMLVIFVPMGMRYRAALAGGPDAPPVPRGFTGLIEALMDALRSSVVRPVLAENTDRFIPFLWTVFFFILINNLLGMIPIDGFAHFFNAKHIGGTATGNVNVTGGLALCAFIMIHFSGTAEVFRALVAGTYGHHHHDEHAEDHGHDHEHGHSHSHGHSHGGMAAPLALIAAPAIYVYNFAPHVFGVENRKTKPPIAMKVVMALIFGPILFFEYKLFGAALGPDIAAIFQWVGLGLGIAFAFNAGGLHPLDFADALMWGFLFLLEVIGALVKPFALCMRLFANMVAGHIVLASILALLPVFAGLSAGYIASSLPIIIGCTLLSCLELFVAFLQAYIFMFLTTMFIGAAVHPEH